MIDLIHGDCLEEMKKIPDQSIDMVLTDPPYGTTACKWDVVIPFELMWTELKRIIKPRGAICLFGSEPFSSHLRLSNLKMFKYDWVWDKVRGVGFLNAKLMPMKRHEIISVFGKSPVYSPVMTPRKDVKKSKCYSQSETNSKLNNDDIVRNYTHKYPTTILEFSNASQVGKLHPTQKPVTLLEYLIKTYTLEGETVLDFTAGSFSTGVAAVNLNRNFIGIEKDSHYFEIGSKRVKEAQDAKVSQ